MDARTAGDAWPREVTCSFVLAGRDADGEACARDIGVAGSEVWRQRHPALAARVDLNNVEVRYTEGPVPDASIDEPLTRLLARLSPRREAIVACARERGLTLGVVILVRIHTERPLLDLSLATLRALVALEATLALDVIDLRPDEA